MLREEQKARDAKYIERDDAQGRRQEQRHAVASDGLNDVLEQLVLHNHVKQLMRAEQGNRHVRVLRKETTQPSSGSPKRARRTSKVHQRGWRTTARAQMIA